MNKSSAIATLSADAAAVVTSLVPSLHLASSVQAAIIGVAGLLTALHVHLSKLIPVGAVPFEHTILRLIEKVLASHLPATPATTASSVSVTNPTLR